MNPNKFNNLKNSKAVEFSKLVDYANNNNIKFGAAIKNEYLSEQAYTNTAKNEFNSFTSEYAMKPNQWWYGINNYNFSEGDKLADFAKLNGIQMRGHTAIWHTTQPNWIINSNYSTQEYKDLLRQGVYDYIKHYTDKYPGMFYAWDVVNEVIDDSGSGNLRSTFWYDKLGMSMFEIAFQAARDASPNTKLVINDYLIEMPGPKAEGIINLVNYLKQKNITVDGVGIQGHFDNGNLPTYQDIFNVMTRFKSAGLEVELTEIDIRDGDQASKGERVYNIVKTCILLGCKGITFWGVTDKYSWYGESASALAFDTNYQPKPMYYKAIQAFQDFGNANVTTTASVTSSKTSSKINSSNNSSVTSSNLLSTSTLSSSPISSNSDDCLI